MNVAIQGSNSSFHAIAARSLFSEDINLIECLHFKDVFAAVKSGSADYGVVAIENSLYGSINDTYDLLVKHDLHICGETYEQIGLHLLGTKDSTLDTITDVYSHPAALGESDEYLDTHLPKAERHEYSDTALSAKLVADSNDPTKASIAGDVAAIAHGLTCLAKNIETHKDNYTRFITLGSSKNPTPSKNCKSSIIFQTANTPGSLYAALGVFAHRSLNLTKLESRPIVGKAWQYMYYIDFDGEFSQELQQELSKYAAGIRLLGSYHNGAIIEA